MRVLRSDIMVMVRFVQRNLVAWMSQQQRKQRCCCERVLHDDSRCRCEKRGRGDGEEEEEEQSEKEEREERIQIGSGFLGNSRTCGHLGIDRQRQQPLPTLSNASPQSHSTIYGNTGNAPTGFHVEDS